MIDKMELHLDEILLRIGLISTALLVLNVASDVWNQGFAFRYPVMLGLSLALCVIGFVCFGLALIRPVPRRAAWGVLMGFIIMLLAYGYLSIVNYNPLYSPHTDNEMIAKFAAEALERGENPYAWNFSDMLRVYRDPGHFTPFIDGAPQNRLTYPVLPTLILWLFDQIGLGEVRFINTLAHLILLIVVFIKTPEWLRPVVLLPLVVFRDFVPYTLNGVQDIIWSLALIGVIYTWKRPTLRALLFGAACTFRQQPWFAAPFLVIYLWREEGTRRERLSRILYFVGISVLFFVVVNLPFVIWNPEAWLRGAVEPSYAAFNFMSQSIGALTQYGIAPFPRLFYSGLQFSSLLILLILYWFYTRPIGQAFWIFPAVFFWLYYRGLANYWLYWLPVLLAAVVCRLDGCFSLPASPASHRYRHVVPLGMVGVIVLGNVGLAGYYLHQDPLISLAYTPPVEVLFDGQVNRLTLTVSNNSSKLFTPRFAVQPQTSNQAWPWHIDSGPEHLQPGQIGQYVISAQETSFKAFHAAWDGQVVVSDAEGDYTLRAVLTIPKQTHYANPDQIANPDYRYWPQDGSAPSEWVLDADPGSLPTLTLLSHANRSALQLQMESNPNAEVPPMVRLTQTVSFPDNFTVWVYPTTDLRDEIYGLEVVDGVHQLWILFGPPTDRATQDGQPTIVSFPAPLNQWSKQVVDLAALYQSLGWTIPLPSMRYANGLRYTVPQVQLSWIVASQSRSSAAWVWGLIEQETGRYDSATLVSNALEHPDAYYVTLGDQQRSQRNYSLAEDFYQKALSINPASSAAYFGLAENFFWSGLWDQAIISFNTALTYGYSIPGLAYKGMGWAYYNLLRYEDALTAFEKSVQLLTTGTGSERDARLADAYSGLGWSKLRLQNCEQAITDFEAALKLDVNHPTASSGLRECQGVEVS